jgi:hypothetical protein
VGVPFKFSVRGHVVDDLLVIANALNVVAPVPFMVPELHVDAPVTTTSPSVRCAC